MRILLCGEGPHEFGDPRVWDAQTKSFSSVEGWLQALLRNLREDDLEFEIRPRRKLQLIGNRTLRPALKGHAEKARLARFIASNEEFDAVIFMVDTDSPDRRRWRDIVAEITSGFDNLPEIVAVAAAVACVPMSASESWLLSDAEAWAALGLTDPAELPKRPETIWGERDDHEGRHPHRYFAGVCKKAGVPDNRDTRVQIATAIVPETLAARCPISFPPFAEAIAAL